MMRESVRTQIEALFPVGTGAVEETIALGRRLASLLPPGSVVALHGDLGAGKTHLVKGAAEALGIPPEEVHSPTFTIVHEHEGELPLYHIDAYRLEGPHAFEEIGYDDYLYGEGICFVEWPSRLAALLPDETIHIELTHAGPTARMIRLLSRSEVDGAG